MIKFLLIIKNKNYVINGILQCDFYQLSDDIVGKWEKSYGQFLFSKFYPA